MAYVALLNDCLSQFTTIDDSATHRSRSVGSESSITTSPFSGVPFHPCHCSQYQVFPTRTTPITQVLEILKVLFAIRTILPVSPLSVKGSLIFPKRSALTVCLFSRSFSFLTLHTYSCSAQQVDELVDE
jgi:hypothetical protein